MNDSIGKNQKTIAEYLETKENSIPNPYMLVSSIEFSQNAQPVTGFMGVYRDVPQTGFLISEDEFDSYTDEFNQIQNALGYIAVENNLVDDITKLIEHDSYLQSFCEAKDKEEITNAIFSAYSDLVHELRKKYAVSRMCDIFPEFAFESSIEPLSQLVTAVEEEDITKHLIYESIEQYLLGKKPIHYLFKLHQIEVLNT